MIFLKRKRELRCEQGSNLCGKIPLDFESNALTTRPSQLLGFCQASKEEETHEMPLLSGMDSEMRRQLCGMGMKGAKGSKKFAL